jgi:HAD superfamily hydrolase (TIGR01509 family)
MATDSRLIIFDFDGVVADSETLANALGAAALSELGLQTTTEEHLTRYMGKSWADYFHAVEADIGRPLPAGYAEARRRELDEAEHAIGAIEGVHAFIDRFAGLPRCVASSNDLTYLHRMLGQLGLAEDFGPNVFSAQQVARGKPFPDLFLHAASTLGAEPKKVLVIEDSPAGVRAGVAAEMTVLGLCAGGHCLAGHGERLLAAGATAVASDYDEAAAFVVRWLAT